jgi:sugar O-acyltransferase (sialic acid O-acetyltransferase NeuD family)
MASKSIYAIYGASGCGRGVMPLAREEVSMRQEAAEVELIFVDDHPPAKFVNGVPVLTYEQFLEADANKKYVCIAIADSAIREKISDRCANDGVLFFPVIANNSVVMDEVEIGEGSILSPFVTLTSNISVGRHFQANIYSYIEHDCIIGDFVTFAPAVKCNGNVVIEDHAYIGAGALLRQGKSGAPLVIGYGAIVGMGAVVTQNVPSGVTVVGNPAHPLVKL